MAIVRHLYKNIKRLIGLKSFKNSADYWERRYLSGGTSGSGSYNRLAEFKAEFLNEFVRENNVETVIEFGSGDVDNTSFADFFVFQKSES